MTVASGCNITTSSALCVINNYISDLSWTCFIGGYSNAAYYSQLTAIALIVMAGIKILETGITLVGAARGKKYTHIGVVLFVNLALIVVAALNVLATAMTKSQPDWYRQYWNDEIANCANE